MKYFLIVILAFVLQAGFLDVDSSIGQEKKPEPKTHTVKVEPIKVFEEVTGTVESAEMAEVQLDNKVWTELVIDEIAAEGTAVKAGDEIATFEMDKIDEKLSESKYGLDLAELAFAEAKLAHELFVSTFDMDVEIAERTWKEAQDDFKYLMETSIPRSIESTEFNLKGSQWSVENAQEEYDQLEKMYKEDELTEESEAIVLKRALRGLQRSKFFLESAELSAQRQLEVAIPREKTTANETHRKAELAHKKQMLSLPMARKQKEIELMKADFTLKKQRDDFEKLEADKQRMSVKSPAAGVVYFGKCVRGKWVSAAGGTSRELESGKTVPAGKVFMTVVVPEKLFLRCDLEEAQVSEVKVGMSGKSTAVAFPDNKMTAKVDTVSSIPFAAGKFDCTMALDGSTENLMPGMSCKVKMLVYENASGIKVPKSAVFSDDDGETHYVFVVKDDENMRRSVETGKEIGETTEIKSGLEAGDKILLAKPE